MRRTTSILVFLAALLAVPAVALALPGKPSFTPGLYGDGQLWGTKAVALLPAPNERSVGAFDKLFVIVNSNNPLGQLPVAEAAPGNRAYHGGKWFTHTVAWTDEGFDAHGVVPVLTSYDDILLHFDLGHLAIWPGSPDGGPPPYFQCPLLPVKGE